MRYYVGDQVYIRKPEEINEKITVVFNNYEEIRCSNGSEIPTNRLNDIENIYLDNGNYFYHKDMIYNYSGKTATIIESYNDYYKLDIDNVCYRWENWTLNDKPLPIVIKTTECILSEWL